MGRNGKGYIGNGPGTSRKASGHRDTNKWKDVWMPKVSPNGSLFAESLSRKSEEVARRVKYDDGTNLAPPITLG